MALRHPSVRKSQTPPCVAAKWFGRAVIAVLVAMLVGIPAASSAQAIRGTLLGTVTDSSGAAVPGATVTITEIRTNVSASTSTNESGNYTFPNLREGFYRVEGELTGFKKVIRDNVQVDVNTTVRVDMELAAGEVTETVTVASEVPALQTDRADTGRIIEGQQIQAMPLGFNRNFQGMLATVPGAIRPFRPHSEFFNPHDSLSTNVNGQSRLANNVQIEGIDNNHKTGLLTVLIPSAEALEEVSVTTSNYDAELGRAGGAVTSVTLKSGTNQFKGSGFWFGNNESTRAKNPFTDRTLPEERQKADELYNQYGFTLGGPIVRNKLFFFGDYIRTNDDLGRINRFIVPPAEWRNGDLSAARSVVYDPLTGDSGGNDRTPFANNQIPASRISPIARSILANMPLPNLENPVALAIAGQPNYQEPTTRERRTDGFDVKINYQASPNDQVSGRYSFQRPTILEPSTAAYGVFGGPFQGGFIGTGTNLTFSTAGNWTRTWSSTLIMDVRGGVSYYHNEALSAGSGLNTATEVGINGANLDEYTSGMTRIEVQNGWSEPLVGFSPSLPWDRSERTVNIAATLTKLWGNHTIKVGGDIRHNRDFLLQTQDQGGPRGVYRFAASQTGTPADATARTNLANSFAAFLLDRPSFVGRDLAVIDPGTKHWAVFSFIADKWQVTPNITLDIGLRHEYYTPLVGLESPGGLSNYDPFANTLSVGGFGEVPEDIGVDGTWTNLDPRLGLSYRINDKNVIRTGFGSSTTPFPDNSYAFNFPVKQNNQFNAPNAFTPPSGIAMATGFPAPLVADIPSSGVIDAGADPLLRNQSYFYVPPDLKEGRLYSWNVAYQRELPWGLTGEVAYVGNYGDDIITRFNMNAATVLGLDNAGRPQFAPFGRTADVTNLGYRTPTRYHALQAKVDRRFRNGFLMTNSYTFGRAKNYFDGDSNGSISTPADIERSYGLSEQDRAHIFVSSAVYNLPFRSEGVLGWLTNGWSVAGLFTIQSGTPLDITGGSVLRAPGNTQRPDIIGEANTIGDVGAGRYWFDTSVFAEAAPNTFGNLTRRGAGIRGPRFINLDASLVKRFEVGATGRYGEFRVDAFNATNSLHPNNPNATFGNASFGQVTGASDPRLVRFGVRFVF
jgi:hypothetical protein